MLQRTGAGIYDCEFLDACTGVRRFQFAQVEQGRAATEDECTGLGVALTVPPAPVGR